MAVQESSCMRYKLWGHAVNLLISGFSRFTLESVKKLGQKSKSEAVVKKEGKTRVRKTEVQKKEMSLNDRSFGIEHPFQIH